MSTQMGESRTKGEKSEVQGDLQIPSSLVALAPAFSEDTEIYTYIFSRHRGVIVRDKKTICGFSSVDLPREEVALRVYTLYGYIGTLGRAVKSTFNTVRSTNSSSLRIGRDIVKEIYDCANFHHATKQLLDNAVQREF